ncbi:MAG: ATP-binding cassette domain-containing protein [Blastochloris viridis]|uniref:ATP-binding cassette domain-containing protein n=1 Tax=Blastochloris viridis TaxID=1079 RepID=A0A6N4RBF9_BLAVI|nr:MAG: ATP-binding cassette domain-containing protein [Blastochloris viridis]
MVRNVEKKAKKQADKVTQARTQQFLWELVSPYTWRLLGGSLMLIVSAAAMLALPQYLKHMFDTALQTGDTAQLAKLAGMMFGTVVVMVVSLFARTWLIAFAGNRILADLRNRLTARLLHLDVRFFESRSSGEIVSRMTADTYALREFLGFSAPQLVRGIFLGIGTLLALLYTSPSLTAILVAACAPIGIMGKVLGQRIRKLARAQQDNLAAYAGEIEETVTNIRTVMAYGQQPRLMGTFEGKTREITRLGDKRSIVSSGFVAVNVVIGFSALIAVVWLGGVRVIAGTMSLGDMMAFLLYLGFAADAASNIGNFWPAWQGTLGATERIIGILDSKAEIAEPKKAKALPVAKGGRGISLKGVRYVYPARHETAALDALDMVIQAGQNVAVVGPSGAGKSTLFRVFLRLDDVADGTVALDGVDVREIALNDLRSQFALVAQESPLFSGTVAFNVRFARSEATDDEVWAALKAAHADGFVKALPKGLNTPVGEKGVQLSGGQRQRLAIARAVLADAPILLLDEATAHLDSESEAAIQNALASVGKGRTVVTIAHRLSTVKNADVIFVMDKGRVVARGSHAELMKTSPLYKALAQLQLA